MSAYNLVAVITVTTGLGGVLRAPRLPHIRLQELCLKPYMPKVNTIYSQRRAIKYTEERRQHFVVQHYRSLR